MLRAIKHNLSNLTNFNGRDNKPTFWFYVLLIVLFNFGASMLLTIPMMGSMMESVIVSAQQHQDPELMQAQMFKSMSQWMPTMMWLGVIVGVISMLLLIASIVRRLHDSNLSGWLAAIPVGLYAISVVQTPAQIKRAMEMMTNVQPGKPLKSGDMLEGQALQTLLVWVPYLLVIIFGLLSSTIGPNRFGEEPDDY